MKNIIITGASDGIGKDLAISFLNDSDNRLFLISRNKQKLEGTFSDNPNVILLPFDLTNPDLGSLISEINLHTSTIDILVNNAGLLVNKPFQEITLSDFDKVTNTNYKAPFFLIQRLLPFFKPGSHIINISSMGGFQGSMKFPGLSLYSSSKGALTILTEILAQELATSGIAVNCLAIGSVNTTMLAEAFPGYRSPVDSDSMAEFIAWFAVNGNKWMNGKVLPVSLSTP